MFVKDLINDLEAKIAGCDERIDYYKKMIEEYPNDFLFEAMLKRCEANKSAYEYELAIAKLKQE